MRMKTEIINGVEVPYVVVRGEASGVFTGFLVKEKGRKVTLKKSRRIWYWEGAASISQIAVTGVKLPEKCKFAMEVDTEIVFDTIEVIPTTEEAHRVIIDVPVWSV